MNSMTGYGRSTHEDAEYSLTIEMSSVNRKGLEVSLSGPKEWFGLDRLVNDIVKSKCSRGRFQVFIKIEAVSFSEGEYWNENVLSKKLQAFKSVCERLGVETDVDSRTLLELMRMNASESDFPRLEDYQNHVEECLERALQKLLEMRASEGENLRKDLVERLGLLERCVSDIKKYAPDIVPNHRKALMDRLQQTGLEISLDDERVLKEISLFVDRCDISEEITRLKSHFAQMSETFESEVAVGRKMDFMVQEIFREFNTIGSKGNQIEISKLVIDAKNELERFREQIQNVE